MGTVFQIWNSKINHPQIGEGTRLIYGESEKCVITPCADVVQSLTKDKAVEKQDRMADSLSRIKKQPREIWMVKLADRITNLQPPPAYWDNEKRVKYLDQAQVIYNELKDGSDYLSERLEKKIQDYQAYIDP